VDADLVYMVADSLVYASHDVIIKRTDLTATGDSAFLDEGRGFIRLMHNPVINGTEERHPFTLKGDVIDVFTENHQLQRVLSKLHADAVSKDMHLTSDTIDLRFHEKVLSRSYAWGPSRARAVTPDRDILADSIDVIMPGQVVHQVRSVRKAFAQAVPDTAHFKSKERDWMKGDTIIAFFDTSAAPGKSSASLPAPPSDPFSTVSLGSIAPESTSHAAVAKPAADSQPQVVALRSLGHARAFYQLPPRDKSLKVPAINYMRGRIITIYLENREVTRVTVVDSAVGVYLEPQADTTARDSAKRAKAALDTVPKPRKGKGAPKTAAPSSTKQQSTAPGTPAPAAVPQSQSPPDTATPRSEAPPSAPPSAPPNAPPSGPPNAAPNAPPSAPSSGPPPATASTDALGKRGMGPCLDLQLERAA
jgi:hypothetical protein